MRVRDLTFSYGEEPVLSELSFDVSSGETLAVMGANGAGKTTLLRLLAGLDEPDAGTIDIDGAVGFAPEDPRAGLFARTVAEEVSFFPRNRGIDPQRAGTRAMQQMEVDSLAERSPLSLSFGEQRRVSIAAVLAGRPAAVTLDEPTAGLDRSSQHRLGNLLRDLEAAVVLTTHATDFAYRFADRVAVLVDGHLERIGPVSETLSDRALIDRAGIRPPGVITWAERQGLEPPPADVREAVSRLRRNG